LQADQMAWISGYLAGLTAAGHPAANEAASVARPATAPAVEAGPAPEVTILYASETGNCEEVAQQAGKRAEALGLKARVEDMLEFKKAQLKKTTHLLAVCATHGEGDPPVPAEEMFELVSGKKARKLKDTK